MKEFESNHRQESRDFDASSMRSFSPPPLQLSAGPIYHFGHGQSNIWEPGSALNIKPGDNGTEFNFDLKGKPLSIHAQHGLELGTTVGDVTLESRNALDIQAEGEGEAFTGSLPVKNTFTYSRDEAGRYLLQTGNGASYDWPIRSTTYRLRSELLSAGPEYIHRKISLIQAETSKKNIHVETDRSGSNRKGGIDVGASGGATVDNKLHVELDGNDVILILGKAKTKVPKKEAMENEALKEALGGFEELLAKQKVTADIGTQGAMNLASYFGYHFASESNSMDFQSSVQEYATGGVLIEDHQEVRVVQDLRPETTALFEQEGQTEASGSTAEQVAAFLAANQAMIRKVKDGFYQIKLSGYASSSGTKAHNQKLSIQRVDEIRDLIVKSDKGINPFTDFTTEGHGSNLARIGSANDADRAVTIEFVKVK